MRVGAFARGDLVLELVAQLVPVHAVGHGLQGPAQERVLGFPGLGFQGQQALLAGNLGKFDQSGDQPADRGDLAAEGRGKRS